MAYLFIDLLTLTLTGIRTSTFLYYINYANIKEFILSMCLLYLLNENIMLIIILSIMFFINILLYKYINKNFIFELVVFTFFYFILFNIDIYYVFNIFLVIVLKFSKYNHTRC